MMVYLITKQLKCPLQRSSYEEGHVVGEDAAAKAGTYVAQRSPEVVRDVVIPRFIDGFERGKSDD